MRNKLPEQINNLQDGKIPLHKLLQSKTLNKTNYKAKTAHSELAKRMEQRGQEIRILNQKSGNSLIPRTTKS